MSWRMVAWTRTQDLTSVFAWATNDYDVCSVRVKAVKHLGIGCVAFSFVAGLVDKCLSTDYLFADSGDV